MYVFVLHLLSNKLHFYNEYESENNFYISKWGIMNAFLWGLLKTQNSDMSQDSSVYVKASNLSELISLFAILGLKSIYFVSPLVYFCHFLVSYVAFYI